MRTLYIRGTLIEELDITPCHDIAQIHATDTPLRRLLATPQQWRGDIKVSCDDSVHVDLMPWNALKSLQTCAVPIDEARSLGFTFDTMEHYYPNGMELLGDSVPNEYINSWNDFVTGIGNALDLADLNWIDGYRLWGRAFFAADGSVDQYFYTWTGDTQPADWWKARFQKVLERYLATFRFAYPMRRNFAQCGGITFVTNKED